jgi:hypothetical protein
MKCSAIPEKADPQPPCYRSADLQLPAALRARRIPLRIARRAAQALGTQLDRDSDTRQCRPRRGSRADASGAFWATNAMSLNVG